MKEATLNLKVEQVNEVVSQMKAAGSIVVVNCIGLTVAQTMDLRKQLYANGCSLKVVKNNILRRASKEMGYDELCENFVGPSAVAYAPDANSAAKIIYAFAKKNDKLSVKAGVVDGVYYDSEAIVKIAKIPSREELLSKLLGSLQSPITNLARVLNQIAEQQN